MIKVTAYPFSKNSLPIVRYIEKFKTDFLLEYIVSPKGVGLEGKDAGFANCRDSINKTVTVDIDEALRNTDSLLVLPGKLDDDLHYNTEKTIIKFLSVGKKVFCLTELGEEIKAEISDKVGQEKFKKLFVDYCKLEWKDKKGLFDKARLYETECPIIFIGGLEATDDFEILLSLILKFKSDGYRVSAVGGERYCEIFGFHSLPYFINSNYPIDEPEKIYALNKIIANIEHDELPDIILIQVPGGMIRFSDEIPNGFGANPFLYSNAFLPSYFICGLMADTCSGEIIEQISADFKVKYSYPIDMLHISHITVQPSITAAEHEFCYFHRDSDYLKVRIDDFRKLSGLPTFDLTNSEMLDEAYRIIIEQL